MCEWYTSSNDSVSVRLQPVHVKLRPPVRPILVHKQYRDDEVVYLKGMRRSCICCRNGDRFTVSFMKRQKELNLAILEAGAALANPLFQQGRSFVLVGCHSGAGEHDSARSGFKSPILGSKGTYYNLKFSKSFLPAIYLSICLFAYLFIIFSSDVDVNFIVTKQKQDFKMNYLIRPFVPSGVLAVPTWISADFFINFTGHFPKFAFFKHWVLLAKLLCTRSAMRSSLGSVLDQDENQRVP
ncbi:hypothetical protein C0J52_12732 [Blattella germanica]|nr:hypothetical protein C0J52_12732 [Blattella germanica]